LLHCYDRKLMRKRFLYALLLLMAVLHQDFWFWSDPTLVAGVLPVGLAYHAVYTLVVALLMWLLSEYAWPVHLEQDSSPSAPKVDDAP
jgi:hypothetical protein